MGAIASVDDASFEREVMNAEGTVLVDVSTEWCPPCKALAPHVEAVAAQFQGRLKVVGLDADRAPEIAARFNVRGFPTLLVMKDGREVARQLGAVSRTRLVALIEPHL